MARVKDDGWSFFNVNRFFCNVVSTLYIQANILQSRGHFENGGHVEIGDFLYIGFSYPQTINP